MTIKFSTPTLNVYVSDDGIIYSSFNPRTRLELEDVVHNYNEMKENLLKEGVIRPILADMTHLAYQSREAREFCSSEESNKIFKACALLTGSSFGKIISNFYLGLNKPHIPTKLFTDKMKAVEWLKQFL